MNLKEKVYSILESESIVDKIATVDYIKNHYKNEGFAFNKDDIISFFEGNFGTGIYYDSLQHSLSSVGFGELKLLERGSWEISDEVGSYVGEYYIEHVISIWEK